MRHNKARNHSPDGNGKLFVFGALVFLALESDWKKRFQRLKKPAAKTKTWNVQPDLAPGREPAEQTACENVRTALMTLLLRLDDHGQNELCLDRDAAFERRVYFGEINEFGAQDAVDLDGVVGHAVFGELRLERHF